MGRWTQYDEDEYRLPEGMKRVGYDSDTGRYYFRDTSGTLYQGAQGAQFSEMTPVGEASRTIPEEPIEDSGDLEAAPSRADGYQPLATDTNNQSYKHNISTSPYRTLFPFFLIIAVVLLLVWRLILSPGLSAPQSTCPEKTAAYWVQPGDSCWEISRAHGCSFEEFKDLNSKVDCEPLMPGTTLCLPMSTSSKQAPK